LPLIHPAAKHIHQPFGHPASAAASAWTTTAFALATATHNTHLLHHLLHFAELLHECIDILYSGATARCNATATTGIEQVGCASFFAGHATNDCLSTL